MVHTLVLSMQTQSSALGGAVAENARPTDRQEHDVLNLKGAILLGQSFGILWYSSSAIPLSRGPWAFSTSQAVPHLCDALLGFVRSKRLR